MDSKDEIAWLTSEGITSLVSVIVPCFNRAALVTQTLDSVWEQTYRPIELLIVDDGSSDNSCDTVEAWIRDRAVESCDQFETKLLRQQNVGVSAARNKGLRASHGEYIQFVDSDDLLHPQKLTNQVAALARSDAGFCVCNYQAFVEAPDEVGERVDFCNRSHTLEDFPVTYPMDTPAPLYRRGAIADAGPWNEALRASEDFEFNFRVVCGGAVGHWIDEVLLYVRRHSGTERIQARSLASRQQDLLAALTAMTSAARSQGRLSRALRHSLGMRALMYCGYMRREDGATPIEGLRNFVRMNVSPMARFGYSFRIGVWKPLWRHLYPAGPKAWFATIAHRTTGPRK